MKNKWFFVILLSIVLLDASSAFAAMGGSGSMPYEEWLMKIADSITGPVAYVVLLLCIAGTGISWAFGGQEIQHYLKTMIFVCIAMAFVIGASEIATNIFGKSALIPELSSAEVIEADLWR